MSLLKGIDNLATRFFLVIELHWSEGADHCECSKFQVFLNIFLRIIRTTRVVLLVLAFNVAVGEALHHLIPDNRICLVLLRLVQCVELLLCDELRQQLFAAQHAVIVDAHYIRLVLAFHWNPKNHLRCAETPFVDPFVLLAFEMDHRCFELKPALFLGFPQLFFLLV